MLQWGLDLFRATLGLKLHESNKAICRRQQELLQSKTPIDRRLRVDDARYENTQIFQTFFLILDRIQALLGVTSVLLVLLPIGAFQIPIGSVLDSVPVYRGSAALLTCVFYGFLPLAGILLFAAVLICLKQIPHRRIYFPDLEDLEQPRQKLDLIERLSALILGHAPILAKSQASIERETQEYLKCIELNSLEVIKANNALSQATEFLRDSLWCLVTAGLAFGAANLLRHLVLVWPNS